MNTALLLPVCKFADRYRSKEKKRLVEHKAAVRRGDTNNGIAVHAWEHQHRVNWENGSVLKQEPGYWKRKIH